MNKKKKSKPKKAQKKSGQNSVNENFLEDVNWEWRKGRKLNEIIKQIVGVDFDTETVIEITRITEHIGNKLIDMYSKKFPKQCNCCDRVYETRNEYLKATFPLRGKESTVYDPFGVQEYRNCVCGSTLLIVTDNRRDDTDFGQARRELFNRCVEELQKITKKEAEEVKGVVRKMFRLIINKSQVVESFENFNVDDID